MGLLNIEENEQKMDKIIYCEVKVPERIADFLVRYGAVRCFVAEEQVDMFEKEDFGGLESFEHQVAHSILRKNRARRYL